MPPLVITDEERNIEQLWGRLLSTGDPATAIFQSPNYVAYLRDIGQQVDLMTVKDANQEETIGIVAVELSATVLPISIKQRTLARMRLRSVMLLGSKPMMLPASPAVSSAALDTIFTSILERYPEAKLIDLHSVPLGSDFWAYLVSSRAIDRLFYRHILHGFRDAHFVVVPHSVADYHSKLTRKRRYNLVRQARVLERHLARPLSLTMLENEDDVPKLLRHFDALSIQNSRKSMMTAKHYEAAARSKILRCFVLEAGDETVGIAIGIKSDRIYYVDRLFHNRALARFSAGTTLWQRVLQFLIEEGTIAGVAMGYGNPSHLYSATNLVDQRGQVLLFRRTFTNRVYILTHSAYTSAITSFKKVIGTLLGRG